jgi:hypothetical protein
MDNDAISFTQPTGPRPTDRRAVLWDELERLHVHLGLEPPTATYILEALVEEVTLARRAAQQPAVKEQGQFDSMPVDAPPEPPHRRPHTTWRNVYGPLFFSE